MPEWRWPTPRRGSIACSRRLAKGCRAATVTDALNNSVIVSLRSQYLDLAARAAEIETRVGPEHMAVAKLHERMNELLRRRYGRRNSDSPAPTPASIRSPRRERASWLLPSPSWTEKQDKSQAQVTMRDIESSTETFRQLYSNFLQKFQEMSTNQTQAIAAQDARIVTRAAPPLYKNSRRQLLVLAGSLMLGLFLGAGAAIARELTGRRISHPQRGQGSNRHALCHAANRSERPGS